MKLLIKQRVFSWTDSYDVYDEDGNVKYFVKAEFFSLTHQLHVYDQYQNEIGIIHEKLFVLTPEFEIEINGKIVGRIKKRLTFLRPAYDVEFYGWKVTGDFLGWDYDVTGEYGTVMHISKELLHWGDTYVIDFAAKEDETMGLLLVIAIDAANCNNGGQ